MKTIPHEDFPPAGAIVIERTDRRVVLLHGVHEDRIDLAVWLRHVTSVRPTVLGGWLCSPDAGLSLTRESARVLFSTLGEVLRHEEGKS